MEKIKDKINNTLYLSWISIFTNWAYQGIPTGGRLEKIYKISFTIFFWILFFGLLHLIYNFSIMRSLIYGFLIAHTMNWLLNCNLYVIFIHRIKWFKVSPIKLFNQLYAIQDRLQNKDWILYSTSSGGISRGTMNGNSDIDVTLIIKPGIKNAILATIFTVKEKKIADFNGIPMDMMVSESPEDSLRRSDYQENPAVMIDKYNMVDSYYKEKMSLYEAQVFNNATK